ncbi:hypothetical protein VSS74_10705 [Conexibacter stalactiti]|uniref:Uncharacterized protein n=1 Tax=Conexibacter stalactiti TaxID=1940611 RepID=A0ABU4HNJ1_9ACTN|nr:hypothetical protein [Conexibacter stalactiti]MDW5594810.1 hypothetical protein [Conexibacter stalactiti]MEC5035452.1 hypothetical protein [Conexibacter stalactiti]
MTSTRTDRLPPHYGGPGTSSFARLRDARVLDFTREAAADALAGRTVWCLSALPSGALAAEAVDACLCRPADDGVATRRRHLGEHWAERDADALLGAEIGRDDVVVLHDPLVATLADAVRARGAHAVWQLHGELLAGPLPRALDACVVHTRSGGLDHLTAALPAPGHVAVKDVEPSDRGTGFGWRSLLADVVAEDRDECVGGTLHVRPVIAAR